MNRKLTAAAAITLIAGLAGCAGTTTGSGHTSSASTSSTPTPSMSKADAMAGMVMSTTPAAKAEAGKPTPTQAMVCGGEIKGEVKAALKLQKTPPTRSTFADALFSCTYTLPVGEMKLSVKHSATDAAALGYAQARRRTLGAAQDAVGLTEHAYQSGTGVVLVVKDNETLEVDTTALPKVFGADHQRSSDLAYEVASLVLGCWTGDNS